MEKIKIENIVLEVTRECNMSCAHCLRGETQGKTMDFIIVDSILSKVSQIGQITFSGGEPSLNLDTIAYTLDYCKKNKIPVMGFYLVTNGKVVTTEFLQLLQEWYTYCIKCNYEWEENQFLSHPEVLKYSSFIDGDEGYVGVALSSDDYHSQIPFENLVKLKSLSFFTEDKFSSHRGGLIDMGRAEKLTEVEKIPHKCETEVYFNSEENLEFLYVNANGDLLVDCDLSYEMQEHYKIGNVLDLKWLSQLKEDYL